MLTRLIYTTNFKDCHQAEWKKKSISTQQIGISLYCSASSWPSPSIQLSSQSSPYFVLCILYSSSYVNAIIFFNLQVVFVFIFSLEMGNRKWRSESWGAWNFSTSFNSINVFSLHSNGKFTKSGSLQDVTKSHSSPTLCPSSPYSVTMISKTAWF